MKELLRVIEKSNELSKGPPTFKILKQSLEIMHKATDQNFTASLFYLSSPEKLLQLGNCPSKKESQKMCAN